MQEKKYHFDDDHFSFDAQMIEERLEVLLQLNIVVLELSNGEETKTRVLPCLVLSKKEGEQHEKTPIVHHPPHIQAARHLQLLLPLLFKKTLVPV